MKKTLICTVAAVFVAVAPIMRPSNAQDQSAQLSNIVNELKKQQAELSDNQAKLDQKITDLSETVRTARLFMSRAGGKHKPPPTKK